MAQRRGRDSQATSGPSASARKAPQKIVIPFTEYTYEWSDFTGGCTDHGAKCCDPEETPNTCPSKTALASISQIGIWGEGTAGTFALDIFSVRAVKLGLYSRHQPLATHPHWRVNDRTGE